MISYIWREMLPIAINEFCCLILVRIRMVFKNVLSEENSDFTCRDQKIVLMNIIEQILNGIAHCS